jgi:hypothetical protein
MSFTNQGTNETGSGGWNTLPQQQHFSVDQGAGGSAQAGGDPQAAVVAAMQAGAQNGNGQGAPTGAAQPQGQPQGGNQFLDGILAQIDPAHRPIVEPYLGKWNAGVTRRFQELHGELEPYKQLGADPDTLAEAYQLYQAIDSNPQGVLEMLQQAMAEIAPQGQPQGQGNQQAPEGEGGQQAALPPEFQEKMTQFEQALEFMASRFLEQQTSQTEEAEDAQLDQYLGNLKGEFGDFDEDFVIAKMMAGVSGEDAVKAYHQAIQGQVNQRARTPNVPPILGGGGAVPQEGKSVVDASPKDTKALVAQILAASQAQ